MRLFFGQSDFITILSVYTSQYEIHIIQVYAMDYSPLEISKDNTSKCKIVQSLNEGKHNAKRDFISAQLGAQYDKCLSAKLFKRDIYTQEPQIHNSSRKSLSDPVVLQEKPLSS